MIVAVAVVVVKDDDRRRKEMTWHASTDRDSGLLRLEMETMTPTTTMRTMKMMDVFDIHQSTRRWL